MRHVLRQFSLHGVHWRHFRIKRYLSRVGESYIVFTNFNNILKKNHPKFENFTRIHDFFVNVKFQGGLSWRSRQRWYKRRPCWRDVLYNSLVMLFTCKFIYIGIGWKHVAEKLEMFRGDLALLLCAMSMTVTVNLYKCFNTRMKTLCCMRYDSDGAYGAGCVYVLWLTTDGFVQRVGALQQVLMIFRLIFVAADITIAVEKAYSPLRHFTHSSGPAYTVHASITTNCAPNHCVHSLYHKQAAQQIPRSFTKQFIFPTWTLKVTL